jgi:hypothetical protein
VLGRFRNFIREYFTRVELIEDDHPAPLMARTTRKARTRSRRYHSVRVSPSERFVWGMMILVVSLIGLIVMETTYIAVTGKVSSELLLPISGLVGALATQFLGKRQ